MSNSVTLILGYPSSGKSTLSAKLASENSIILNRDKIGGTVINLLPKMENLLKNNCNVILDNLFPTVESRAPFIAKCKELHVDINCIMMDTSIEDAQFNFVLRAFDILGEFPTPELIKKTKHPNIFPPAVFFKYRKEFEKPSLEEGFTSIKKEHFVRKDNPEFVNKAVILDYDGTLRECINGNGKYPVSKDQIEIKPRRKKVLDMYREQGYLLLGMSNQSGIHKGHLSEELAHELFQYTNQLLGVDIEYNFCPHQSAPISCYCRKPQSGKGVEMILKHKLNRQECIFVGDYTSDKTFSERCGFRYIDEEEFFK